MARDEWNFRIEVAFGVVNAHLAQLHPDAFDPLKKVKFGIIIRAGLTISRLGKVPTRKKGACEVTNEEKKAYKG